MLQSINDRIKGWVSGFIIAIISAVFGLWGIEYYLTPGSARSKGVAKVDGQRISQEQLSSVYRQLKWRLGALQPGGQPTSAQEDNQIRQLALQQLISQRAMENAAHRAGFLVGLTQAEQAIRQLPEFQSQGQFSPQRLQQFLGAVQTSESGFVAQFQVDLILHQLLFGLEAGAFVLPNELQTAYQLAEERRHFGYFMLTPSALPTKVTVSDQEVKSYYEEHKESYRAPDRVQVQYLLLSPEAIASTISITPAQLQAYYNSHQASYALPKRWHIVRVSIPISKEATDQKLAVVQARLKHIQQQLKDPSQPNDWMKQPDLQVEHQTLTTANMPARLTRLVTGLTVHQVSAPIYTDQGVDLIQLVSVEEARTIPFVEAKDQIRRQLLHQAVQERLARESEQLTNLTYTNPATLKVAAETLGLTPQTSPWLTQQGVPEGLFSDAQLISAAFSDDVMAGNNSLPITLKTGALVVLRMAGHQPSAIQPLSSVRQAVQRALLKERTDSQLGLLAYQVSAALSKGSLPEALAQKYGLRWIVKSNVKRDDQSLPKPILTTVFATPPSSGKGVSGVNTTTLDNGNYVVLRVLSAQPARFEAASVQSLQSLKDQLTQLNRQKSSYLYGRSVLARAKVKIL